MKIPSSIWTLLIGIVLTLVSLWYGQNHGLLPVAASNEATLVDGLFNTMMIVSTGIFLIVEGVLIYCAFKYRRRSGDETDGPPVYGNIPLEILWTAIPAVIVLGISIYSFEVYNSMGGFDPHGGHGSPMQHQSMKMPGAAIAATLSDTPQPDRSIIAQNVNPQEQAQASALEVNVTGLQYAFIFTYPETGVVSGELHVPIGQEVVLNMSANDVIHAFWVPEFRLKQDIIPGRETQIRFTPKTKGDYAVVCAELCGPYHGAMRTQVIVQTPEEFEQWQQEQLVASREELSTAVAAKPDDMDADKFLAPYIQDMGIQPEIVTHLHHQH